MKVADLLLRKNKVPKFEREISEARALSEKKAQARNQLAGGWSRRGSRADLVKANVFEEAAIILLNGVGVSEKDYNKLDTLKTRYVSLAASLMPKRRRSMKRSGS